jgi:membrane fusion protein
LPPPETPLFRPEALRAQAVAPIGTIVLVSPPSYRLLGLAALLIGAAIVSFGYFGTYTRHTTLTGRLAPDRGVIAIAAPQLGTIVAKNVAEGSSVEAGDVVYLVASERFNSASEEAHDFAARQLAVQERSLRGQMETLATLELSERSALARMTVDLEAEIASLREMVRTQRERVALAEETALRYRRIEDSGFASAEQLAAKQADMLEQRSRLNALERDERDATGRLAELAARRAASPLEHQNRIAELERAISELRRERSETEIHRLTAVKAPERGTATLVGVELGQAVDIGQRLLSIVPAGSKLLAQLDAPSRAAGFIDAGDRVLLRFEAYPYQRFGHMRGTVRTVSLAAAMPAELGAGRGAEPVYRVTVELSSQSLWAYGRSLELQAGMAVEADVLLETRRLYEWVLEPLLTLSGKIHD